MRIRTIAIFGGGIMGQGIARTVAQYGYNVILVEKDEKGIVECQQAIEMMLDRDIERWGITRTEKTVIMQRISLTHSYDDAKNADFVIESVAEIINLKRKLFEEMDKLFPPEIILASNTATMSISELASHTNRPENVVGMHFMNPVHRRPLVEIVRGLHTSDQTVQVVRQIVTNIGKIAVEVLEYPGFVTTRIIIPFVNEAMYVVLEGVASAQDVDTAMRLGFNLPIGPLEMADQMGLDSVQAWMEYLFEELGDLKYRPCPLLRKMVRAGHLGVKTRQGFFTYDERGNRVE